MKKITLIKVEPGENNNKIYEMVQLSADTWKGFYGRVGAKLQESPIYSMRIWDRKYRERIDKKGYKDVTSVNTTNTDSELIGDERSLAFADLLQRFSNKSFESNYIVDSSAVTQAKIDEVQAALNLMAVATDVNTFNDNLVNIFSILPRRMRRVDDHIAKSESDFSNIIALEQDNVDVLKGQVITFAGTGKQTLEEAYGLNISPVNASEQKFLKDLMKESKGRYIEAYKVSNVATQASMESYVSNSANQDVWQLFHGSRNENWWSILNNGLMLYPTSAKITGKMFGYGLYMANKARKSIGYCSSRGSYWANGTQDHGILAVYKVHVGKQMHIKRWKSEHKQLTKDKLKGHDSVYAHGGADLRNDEFIIYDQHQCSVDYLIKFS